MTTDTPRKPRIALMGEFSSGKSTLSNLLLGARPLPEKVTATRLSPVWMAQGTEDGYRIDVDGTEEPIDLGNLEAIDVDATRVIRLFFEADILEVCDLIDFPGISDPNMSSEVWQRMLCDVDAILWCTHATQAWRQSEAAVWETIPEPVKARSLLLVTKFDKLHSDRDRARVLARLQKETGGQFDAIFPISLTRALAAGDDLEAFERSGGAAFLNRLIDQIEALHEVIGGTSESLFARSVARQEAASAPVAQARTAEEAAPLETDTTVPDNEELIENREVSMTAENSDTPETNDAERVTPRRVRPATSSLTTARPRRPAARKPGFETIQGGSQSPRPQPGDASDLDAIFRTPQETS